MLTVIHILCISALPLYSSRSFWQLPFVVFLRTEHYHINKYTMGIRAMTKYYFVGRGGGEEEEQGEEKRKTEKWEIERRERERFRQLEFSCCWVWAISATTTTTRLTISRTQLGRRHTTTTTTTTVWRITKFKNWFYTKKKKVPISFNNQSTINNQQSTKEQLKKR